jgi:glycosyltransferase involved in cell wall biosynthesis
MTSAPTISIVMPCFNRLRHLRTAVQSVCDQTFGDWEFIIVDDGSDEPTREYLRGLADPRVRLIEHTHTGNQSILRNLAITQARGRYVAFMDSDDVWIPARLELQLATMREAPRRRWSYCNCSMIDEEGRLLPAEAFVPWVPLDGTIVEALLTFDASVSTAAVIVERGLLDEAGGFDEQLRFCQSHELWLRLALRSEVGVCALPLVLVRTHDACFTSDRIGTAAGWLTVFAKAAHYLDTPRLRRLSRRRFRESALALARLQAGARQWTAAFATLGRAQTFGVAAPLWWMRAAAMLGRTLIRPRARVARTRKTGIGS